MKYFYTKYGTIVDENMTPIPMVEGNPIYEEYLLFLQADGAIEQTDYVTNEELEELRRTLIPQTANKMRFFLALLSMGITRAMVHDVINQITDENIKEIVLIKFHLSEEFDRNDEHLNMLANNFEITQTQLDNLFIQAN